MKFSNILVDADILLYQIGFATQRNIYSVWLEGHEGDPSYVMSDKRALNKILKKYENYELHKEVYVQPFLSASTTIDAALAGLKKRLGAPECNVELFLTGEGNFREEVATIQPYKGNRVQDKPVHYDKIKEYLLRKGAHLIDGQEADDALSISQLNCSFKGQSSIICSIDKDLNQVPGWHYNSTKDKVYYVSKEEGIRWFYEQLLQGDTADNIPGLPGIGPKTATRILEDCETPQAMEDRVRNLYEDYEDYKDTDTALVEVGQLLWMRTQPNEMWYPLYMGGCRYGPD